MRSTSYFLTLMCVAMTTVQAWAAKSAIENKAGCVVLSNGRAAVSFNVANGTFTIRDAEGRVRLADAGVGATSVKRGAAFTATTDEVNDAFGHGARITFTVRDDTAGARWGFHDAGYAHPHSKGAWEPVYTYTLYDDSPALIASFGVNTPVWYRRRLMGAHARVVPPPPDGRDGRARRQVARRAAVAGRPPYHWDNGELTR